MAILKSEIILGNFVQSFVYFLFSSYLHTKEEKSLNIFLFFGEKNSYLWYVSTIKIVLES